MVWTCSTCFKKHTTRQTCSSTQQAGTCLETKNRNFAPAVNHDCVFLPSMTISLFSTWIFHEFSHSLNIVYLLHYIFDKINQQKRIASHMLIVQMYTSYLNLIYRYKSIFFNHSQSMFIHTNGSVWKLAYLLNMSKYDDDEKNLMTHHYIINSRSMTFFIFVCHKKCHLTKNNQT